LSEEVIIYFFKQISLKSSTYQNYYPKNNIYPKFSMFLLKYSGGASGPNAQGVEFL